MSDAHEPVGDPEPEPVGHCPWPSATTWSAGVLAGLVAAMAGLAVAELVAAARSSLQSPVLDVGDRVVDGVPNSVKELAIDWFGTNDKIALLAGIGSLLAVYAAVVGVASVTARWRWSVGAIALFGLVGAYASQTTRRAAPWYAVVPSLAGGAVAALTLVWLRGRLLGSGSVDEPSERPTVDRRRFLVASGATAVGAAVVGVTGRRLGTRSDVASVRDELGLPAAPDPLPPVPAGVSADVEGVSPFFTPNADFYRIDTALTVPQVAVNGWELAVSGMVDRELTLGYDDLLDRDIVEADITLTCVSNEVGGNLLGTARWLGVRLDDLLADAGVDPAATQVVGRSVDGYTCGFPTAVLDGRDALVAIGMNGEPLPLEHGYPARLIVPGLYGYVSATKWLTEIELTTFDAFDQYWVERGWVDDAPIKIQSRIDTPRGLATVPAGTTAIAGVAWAQTRGIDAVHVQIDDGEWVPATLADELDDVTWRQWSYAWEATPGRHSIRVRATERGGAIQTDERSEPFPSGATGRHQIVVIVTE
jgi:DMSO/TMAO reductase YedYZ molybdopterin-dependent catalytic subunit